MDWCWSHRKGSRRGPQSWQISEERGISIRKGIYLLPEKSGKNAECSARWDGSGLDSGWKDMASQRKTLRHAAGIEQSRDSGQVWGWPGAGMASQLRCTAVAPGKGRRTLTVAGSALQGCWRERSSADGGIKRYRRTYSSLLEQHHRTGDEKLQPGDCRCTRKQFERYHQTPEAYFRRRDREPEPAHCHSLCFRIRRWDEPAKGLLPGRSRRDQKTDGCCGKPGKSKINRFPLPWGGKGSTSNGNFSTFHFNEVTDINAFSTYLAYEHEPGNLFLRSHASFFAWGEISEPSYRTSWR